MGSNSSKPNNESVASLKHEADPCSSSDPRSPTPEITRTPLQGKPGAKHNITKNVDLRKTFENAKTEEKLIHNNPILSAVIKSHLQSYDPRSPTQDFERTPIVIGPKAGDFKNDKMLRQIDHCASPQVKEDENCDSCNEAYEFSPDLMLPKNLCDGFYDISLSDSKETCEPLGSSTASNEAIERENSVITKPTQLLETNFDYVECDKFEDSVENNDEPLNIDTNQLTNIPLFKILDVDPRSPSIGIDRTPLVVAKIDEDSNEDNVEEMSDDSLIKALQSTNAELRQNGAKLLDANGDGLLVYEDEVTNINDTPKKSKLNTSGSRTPLSCMKNKGGGHARSKSTNTLYNPKKVVSKIPKRVSHIPRLKSLSKIPQHIPTESSISLKFMTKGAISGDCENTPPHSHRDSWDKDSSIVL